MPKKAPSIGVLIPSYNHVKFINERVDSVLSQSFEHTQVYIVDDCSSDGTWEALQKYLTHERVSLHRNPFPSGSPFTHYLPIFFQHQHDYWWVAESDDVADSEFLNQLITVLEDDHRLAFAYSNSTLINADGESIGSSLNFLEEYFPEIDWKQNQYLSVEIGLKLLTRGQIVPNMSSLVFRATAIDLYQLQPIKNFKLAGDWFFMAVLQANGPGYFVRVELNRFRSHLGTAREGTEPKIKSAEYLFCNFIAWKKSTNRESLISAVQDTLTMAKHSKVSFFSLIGGLLNLSKRVTLKLLIQLGWEFQLDPLKNFRRMRSYFESVKRVKS